LKLKRREKEYPRKTATFAEHLRFYSLPFFLTTTFVPALYVYLTWLICYRNNEGDANGLLAVFWFPIVIAALIFFCFRPRIKLLSFDNSWRYRFPNAVNFYGHWMILMLAQKALTVFIIGQRMIRDTLGETIPDPEQLDYSFWLIVTYLLVNTLWLAATSIPVLDREKLYRYKQEKRSPGNYY
jgi:hypothetical protein